MAETIKSFMVSLGWENNDVEYRKFESALTSATTKGILLGEAIEETARKVAAALTSVAANFEKLNYIGERSGAAVKDIQALEFAFKKTGVSAAETDAAIQAMSRNIRDKGPGWATYAKQLGFEFDGATGKFIRFNAETAKAVKNLQPATAAIIAGNAGLPDNMLTAERLHADALAASIKQRNEMQAEAGGNPQEMADNFTKLENAWTDFSTRVGTIYDALAAKIAKPLTGGLEALDAVLRSIETDPQIKKSWDDLGSSVEKLLEDTGITKEIPTEKSVITTLDHGVVALNTDFKTLVDTVDAFIKRMADLEEASKKWEFIKLLSYLSGGTPKDIPQGEKSNVQVGTEAVENAAGGVFGAIGSWFSRHSTKGAQHPTATHSANFFDQPLPPRPTRSITFGDGKEIGLERADDKIFGSSQSRSLEPDSGPTKGLSGSWNDFANALTFGLAGKDQIKVNGQPISTSNPMPVTLGQADKFNQEWGGGRGGDGLGGGTGGASLGDAGRRGGTLPPDGQAVPLPDTRTPWQKYAPKILGGKDAPTTKTGPSGVAYTAKSLTEAMGINQKEYDAFREGLTDIEGKKYNRMGGAGGHYAGRYQMGPNEITDTARRLGVGRPTNEQFLGDPALQEKFFENYTLDHYRELLKNPKFAAMSHKQQLQILGYAHNQGVGSSRRGTGAMGYLDSGRSGADAWGTSGTAYFGPIGRRYDKAMADATGQAEKAAHAAPVAKPSPLKAATPARGDDEDDDDPLGEDEKRAADKPKTNQAPTHPQPAPPVRAPSEWSAPAPTVYDASRIKGALNSVGLGGPQSEQIIANHIKAQTPAAQGDTSNDNSTKNSHNNVNQKVEIHVAGSDDSAGVARMVGSHVTREFSDLTSNLKSAAQ